MDVETFVGVGEAAKLAGADQARRVSDLFYANALDSDVCPVVSGRRLIPVSYIPEVRRQLQRRGWVKKERAAVG